ncbi:MAG TPA: hypothetical protein VGO55_17980 [Allosphingosinicella sp.]|jgi:hypothetical protein|nr:hypothetical protein [Allosphingosinicella sp.]
MIARLLLSTFAVAAVPLAVHGAEGPSPTANPQAKRTCQVETETGSRLGGVRRCRSAAEREALKQESRRVVDRIQAFKATMCAPPRPAC